jgi:alpha-tubulin suppressor-like RCC1 family protein
MTVNPVLNTNGASVQSCTIAPYFNSTHPTPPGLTIHNTTCVISGAPNSVFNATFRVTVATANGSANALVTLSAIAAPSLSFANAVGTVGVAMSLSPLLATHSAAVQNCTIQPALPSGFSIANNTCMISGTPVSSFSATPYTVTLTTSRNATVTATFNLSALAPSSNPAGGASGMPHITGVSSGTQHSCAVDRGALKCWGNNTFSQLGRDPTDITPPNIPSLVVGLNSNITAVSAAERHTCAVQSTGLKCWGENTQGLVIGHGNIQAVAQAPHSIFPQGSGVTAVATGNHSTCVIQNSGLKCWGLNPYGELGRVTTSLAGDSNAAFASGLTSNVSAVAAGDFHFCAIQSVNGQSALKCFGNNLNGQLGRGSKASTVSVAGVQFPTPEVVQGLSSNVTAVAAGADHTCAIQNGALNCWGSNARGQLGVAPATLPESLTPFQVPGLESGVTAVAAGSNRTCAIHGGTLKCWGGYSFSYSPLPVLSLGANVSAFDLGHHETCAIQDSSLSCWLSGHNQPVPVSGLSASPFAPTLSYPSGPQFLFLGEWAVVMPTMQTHGANVTSCTISPALPQGLSIRPVWNNNNPPCVIYGYPEVAFNQIYTVTLTTSTGSTTAQVTLEARSFYPASPPVLTYAGTYSGPVNQAFSVTPTIQTHGYQVVNCEIILSGSHNHQFISNLSIDPQTCVITGLPIDDYGGHLRVVITTNAPGGALYNRSGATFRFNIHP